MNEDKQGGEEGRLSSSSAFSTPAPAHAHHSGERRSSVSDKVRAYDHIARLHRKRLSVDSRALLRDLEEEAVEYQVPSSLGSASYHRSSGAFGVPFVATPSLRPTKSLPHVAKRHAVHLFAGGSAPNLAGELAPDGHGSEDAAQAWPSANDHSAARWSDQLPNDDGGGDEQQGMVRAEDQLRLPGDDAGLEAPVQPQPFPLAHQQGRNPQSEEQQGNDQHVKGTHADEQQADEHADEQPHQHADEQPHQHADGQPGEQADEQPGEHADEQAGEQANEQLEEQADEQPGEQPEEHADEQPHQHADGQPDEQPDQHADEQPDQHPNAQADQQPEEQADEQPDEQADQADAHGEDGGRSEGEGGMEEDQSGDEQEGVQHEEGEQVVEGLPEEKKVREDRGAEAADNAEKGEREPEKEGKVNDEEEGGEEEGGERHTNQQQPENKLASPQHDDYRNSPHNNDDDDDSNSPHNDDDDRNSPHNKQSASAPHANGFVPGVCDDTDALEPIALPTPPDPDDWLAGLLNVFGCATPRKQRQPLPDA